VANVEVRWAGLTHELVRDSLRRLMEDVLPILEQDEFELRSVRLSGSPRSQRY
jgi:hypothetical protein